MAEPSMFERATRSADEAERFELVEWATVGSTIKDRESKVETKAELLDEVKLDSNLRKRQKINQSDWLSEAEKAELIKTHCK